MLRCECSTQSVDDVTFSQIADLVTRPLALGKDGSWFDPRGVAARISDEGDPGSGLCHEGEVCQTLGTEMLSVGGAIQVKTSHVIVVQSRALGRCYKTDMLTLAVHPVQSLPTCALHVSAMSSAKPRSAGY